MSFKGRTHNAALVAWVDNIAAGDAHIVKILRNAGAVFHVRTNQPQTVMVCLEYGRTADRAKLTVDLVAPGL